MVGLILKGRNQDGSPRPQRPLFPLGSRQEPHLGNDDQLENPTRTPGMLLSGRGAAQLTRIISGQQAVWHPQPSPAAFLCKLRSLSRAEAAGHEKPPDPLDPPEEESRPVERSALCQMGDEA